MTKAKYTRGMPVEYEGPITCRTCQTERPHTDFYVRDKRRRTDCKFCMRRRARDSTERVQVGDTRWLTRREGMLQRKYGITNADFDKMVAFQQGRCAICHNIPSSRRRNTRTGREWTPLHVDHDHATGKVRGLLCHRCNSAVGWIEAQGLENLLWYLDGLVASLALA